MTRRGFKKVSPYFYDWYSCFVFISLKTRLNNPLGRHNLNANFVLNFFFIYSVALKNKTIKLYWHRTKFILAKAHTSPIKVWRGIGRAVGILAFVLTKNNTHLLNDLALISLYLFVFFCCIFKVKRTATTIKIKIKKTTQAVEGNNSNLTQCTTRTIALKFIKYLVGIDQSKTLIFFFCLLLCIDFVAPKTNPNILTIVCVEVEEKRKLF